MRRGKAPLVDCERRAAVVVRQHERSTWRCQPEGPPQPERQPTPVDKFEFGAAVADDIDR